MKIASLVNAPALFVEIGSDRLKAWRGADAMELAVERGPDGRLTAAGKEKAVLALKNFLNAKGWQPRPKAWCAINARGVSLRRLSLPGGAPAEFQQRLLLQIEAEFPLPPEELAWGWQPVVARGQGNGAARQEVLVAALKKEWLADYQEILRACGADPVFTLASVARWHAGGQAPGSFAMLEVGPTQSELTFFENAVPASARMVFSTGLDAAKPSQPALDALAQSIKDGLGGARLYVSGSGLSREFVERLERTLANGCRCELLAGTPADGGTAALAGLEKMAAQSSDSLLLIGVEPTAGGSATWATLDWKKWGGRIAALALAALLLPYAEALLLKWHLERKVAAFKKEAERLTVIDRELDFLRNLKLSQPPYLDVLYVFSKSVPPGTHFDSLSLNSHGEVSLRSAFHDGQQVADFRDKLIASGFFTNVVVEDQSPTPDRQRVNVRIRAQEKSAGEMQAASARLAAGDTAKSEKPGGPEAPPDGPPMPPRKEPK